jgi:gluconolactonase
MTVASAIQILDPRAKSIFSVDGIGSSEGDQSLQGAGKSVPTLIRLGGGTTWCEGPVWLEQFGCLLYSDIPANRMMCWNPQQGVQVWRNEVEFTNGHALQADGSLLHCSHGQRAITRTRFIGNTTASSAKGTIAPENSQDNVLVDHYLGGRLNSPNDIVVKSDGSIWFTDPPYGILSDREGHKAPSEQKHNYVFCFSPTNPQASLQALSHFVEEPNGLAFSPDEQFLYVSDTSAALRTDGSGNHHIVKFLVSKDANSSDWKLSDPTIFAVVTPGLADGFKLDTNGFLYTSSENSVQVYHPDGTRVATIAVPEKIGNLCFGGPSNQQLFICASTSLYSIRLNAVGASPTTASSITTSSFTAGTLGKEQAHA